MKFEWDAKKNAVNSRRHRIDFADVPEMFNYYMLIDLDDREDYQEDRWVGIEVLRNSIAVVVFTGHQHPVGSGTKSTRRRIGTDHQSRRELCLHQYRCRC